MSIQIPIINIDGLVEGDGDALERVSRELRAPCERIGVFHLVGEVIDAAELSHFDRAMRQLFALPQAQKDRMRRSRDNAWGYYDRELTKNRPDWKQVFDYGRERDHAVRHSDGHNRWPAATPELKPVLLRHQAFCERVATALIRAISVSLGLPADRMDAFFVDHSSFVRLNYYPRCTDPAPPDADWFPEHGRLGVHHHTDAGALTILYQDDVPGLQVFATDRFELIEPVPGALTVNLGDMLQVWSNDRYHSPIHRVLANADRERFSAPFFLNPSYDAVCEPLASSEPPRFRPISWSHFRDRRSAGDFADYGAEIQIADYRIEPDSRQAAAPAGPT